MFGEAFEEARQGPCILFLDEVDSLCPRRGKHMNTQELRLTSQLLNLMDNVSHIDGLLVIGATNRPHDLDSSIRRPGRFDKEIIIGIPTFSQRLEILSLLIANAEETDVDLFRLAEMTPGYTGADLSLLCQEAAFTRLRASQDDCHKVSKQVALFMFTLVSRNLVLVDSRVLPSYRMTCSFIFDL